MLAIGCGLELFPLFCCNASQLHQSSGLMLATMKPKSIQLLSHPSAAVRCFRFLMNGTNPGNQLGSLLLPGRCSTLFPVVITATAHLHDFTQQKQRERLLLDIDKRKSQTDSFAKKAVAFFRISRSIRKRSFSRRNCLSSDCS